MSEESPYKVRLQDLPARKELKLDSAFVRESIAHHPMRKALDRPAEDANAGAVDAVLDLYGSDDDVFARGTLKGWLDVACARCLGEVRVMLDDNLMVTFLPKERVPEDDPDDVEVTEDDEDLFPYEGEEVDLEPLLRERVLLSVPFSPLCQEACKGLCVSCGADLNLNPCQCEQTSIDPRLAALKDLKLS